MLKQMVYLEQRGRQVGEARIREVEAEWPRLMAEMGRVERGTDRADPRVQELARRWRALIEEFKGGDPGIRQSLE